MDYAANRKYFSPKPAIKPFATMIGIGAVLLFGGGKFGWGAGIGIGIGLIVLGIVLWVVVTIRPSDAEIEAQAKAMFDELDAKAFKKLGIDPSEVSLAKPVTFWGFRFEYPSILGDIENNKAIWVCGKDGKDRSSEVTMTGFYFGENSVYCYERTQSLVSDALKEKTEEYFYKDIVSVKTDSSNIPFVDEKGNVIAGRRIRSEAFILTNMGGERKDCPVAVASEAEAAVGAFRTLLKQKKI